MSKVAIIMGSKSDLPVMQEAIDILKGFDIDGLSGYCFCSSNS